MLNTDVPLYRPSDGDLIVPNILHAGAQQATDSYRKMASLSPRPSTGSSRFGHLSHSSFFTRHNPQPGRVRHIKGLNDIPICAVNDDGFFPDARYKLDLPGSTLAHTKFKATWDRIPVNAINVNSQLHPINTVTGLQFFTGLSSYPYREKALPKLGMVPVTERWRQELQTLTAAAGLIKPPKAQEEPKRPMYSAQTGRLLPPLSRAMSRGTSRKGVGVRAYEHITQEQDMENNVLRMLCQILQTDDVNAVQGWLVAAGEQEKAYVLDLIKSAMTNSDEYQHREPAVVTVPHQENKQSQLLSSEQLVQQVDRLSLDGVAPRETDDANIAKYTRYRYNDTAPPAPSPAPTAASVQEATVVRPSTTDAFRPKQECRTPVQANTSKEVTEPTPTATLRYIKSATKPSTASVDQPANLTKKEADETLQ